MSLHTLTPLEVAARCRRLKLEKVAWLDSSLPNGESVSIVAAQPGRMIDSWGELERCVHTEVSGGAATAIGLVEYDGALKFACYDRVLIFQHGRGRWEAPNGAPDWLADVEALTPDQPAEWRGGLTFASTLDEERYGALVRRAQEHIGAGDIYQVNLAHRFTGQWPEGGDAFALYRRLRTCSPAPQSAFLDFGDRAILCASPEEFLRLDGRRVRTRPIKGTRPRSQDSERDAASAAALLSSEKERAELLMITDLLRNDLGAISEFGSVRASELCRLENFAQIFHLVSTVEGVLRAGVSHVEALRACLPGGSITGAPKRRAREIIRALEPEPRGLYTGSIGVFGPGDFSRFNIAIRTLIVEGGVAYFHVGAGIVADSDPAAEWRETLAKAAGILRAAGAGSVENGDEIVARRSVV